MAMKVIVIILHPSQYDYLGVNEYSLRIHGEQVWLPRAMGGKFITDGTAGKLTEVT